IIASLAGDLGQTASDVGETFGFNWDVLVSQIISFLVVAFVLQRFAYKPIINILEERRTKIAEGLANAEKIKKQLAESEARHAEILSRANTEAQAIIEEARAAASALAEKRQQQAIADAEAIATKTREALALER